MKVLLYISVYDPHVPLTGGGTRGGEFVNILGEQFALDLIYIDGSGQPADPTLSKRYANRVKGICSKKRIAYGAFDYFIFSKHLYKEAKQRLEKQQYDVILCDYGLSAVYGLLLSKQFKVPFVYCSHNLEHKLYAEKIKNDKRRLVLLPYVYIIERLGVKKASIVVAITKDDAKFYKRWTDSEKIVVIPQGFDKSVFNPFYEPRRDDRKIILFAGNYGIQANVDAARVVVDKIIDKVVEKFPDTLFQFIGAHPPTDIRHTNAEFTGFSDNYPAMLRNADVVLSPVLQGQGFPTKIVEALACGKPIVATPIGARALERDYKTLHIVSIEEFPDTINRLLAENNPVSSDDFDKVEQRFSWRTNVMELAAKIKELMDS